MLCISVYFTEEVMKFKLCEGIDKKYSTRNTKLHHLQNWNENCLSARTLTRSPLCQVAFLGDEQCSQCARYQYKSKCNKEYCDRKREVSEEELVDIDDSLHSDFMELLHSESGDMNEWQQMFFREQIQNSKKSAYCCRYHPDVVRWAIELYSRSPSAYQHLVTTDVLKLPSSRTLQKFRNIGTNAPGLNQIAVEAMKKLKSPVEAYLTVDEMKVKESLVYKDGQLVGFVDFGDRYTEWFMNVSLARQTLRWDVGKALQQDIPNSDGTAELILLMDKWFKIITCSVNSFILQMMNVLIG
ncbi:uncharacterized protein LOC108949689 [Ciona intestinalis]